MNNSSSFIEAAAIGLSMASMVASPAKADSQADKNMHTAVPNQRT
jgi:hypothetical protein